MKNSKFNYILLSIGITLMIGSCKKDEPTAPETNFTSDWELLWADEFEGDSVDTEAWIIYDTPKDITSRTGRPENLRIENGILIMELHEELHNGMQFTGSEIASKEFTLYGRYECRAKLPQAPRAWCAFWTLGDFGGYGAWPLCGEVDILEYWGYNDLSWYTNIHTAYSNWQNNVDRDNHYRMSTSEDLDAFHVYAMEWYPDRLEFFVDDVAYWTYYKIDDNPITWPFDQHMQVLFMMYAAPNWVGTDEDLPSQFQVDYVRVYGPPQ
ncbi:MAG: glycoside hydrolase family 16 protein [Flavobacteriales bacterium]|nr:glycoside hydrolase family 16 protein [Flavobacteriales bacterium]